jgi:hypothetical protein
VIIVPWFSSSESIYFGFYNDPAEFSEAARSPLAILGLSFIEDNLQFSVCLPIDPIVCLPG